MTDCCIIIPARLESTRLPNKVLLDIAGKPMLQHVWQVAVDAEVGPVYITTDSEEIESAANDFGAQVLRSGEHRSGTDRIASVIGQLSLRDDDIVINLQGDEPLMPPELLREFAGFAQQQLTSACSVYSRLDDTEKIDNPNCVKVVCDRQGWALYFSRSRIPAGVDDGSAYKLHHGLYAYRVGLLKQWPGLPRGPLEQAEKLEQLRLLENGQPIAMLESRHRLPRGVDTEEDLHVVRQLLMEAK